MDRNVLRSFVGKKCLVTGGTGLIGRQVLDILGDAGARVKSASFMAMSPSQLILSKGGNNAENHYWY